MLRECLLGNNFDSQMFDFLSRGLTVCLMMSEADGVLRLHDRFYDGDCMTEIRSIFSIKVDKHIYPCSNSSSNSGEERGFTWDFVRGFSTTTLVRRNASSSEQISQSRMKGIPASCQRHSLSVMHFT